MSYTSSTYCPLSLSRQGSAKVIRELICRCHLCRKFAQIEMAARILCSLADEAPQAFLRPPIVENLKVSRSSLRLHGKGSPMQSLRQHGTDHWGLVDSPLWHLQIHMQAASCRCPMSCPVWSPEACEIQVNALGCCLLHAASAKAEVLHGSLSSTCASTPDGQPPRDQSRFRAPPKADISEL